MGVTQGTELGLPLLPGGLPCRVPSGGRQGGLGGAFVRHLGMLLRAPGMLWECLGMFPEPRSPRGIPS